MHWGVRADLVKKTRPQGSFDGLLSAEGPLSVTEAGSLSRPANGSVGSTRQYDHDGGAPACRCARDTMRNRNVTKGLIHGVPLICVPLVGDQPDNAARVGARDAGIKISNDVPAEQIGAAIQRVLSDRRFRTAARRLGAAMARDGDAVENAVQAIERVL
jgi:hypothetical protein